MSGFNNNETVHVIFDPLSINACEKQVLLPAFYLKQRDRPRSASYAKFASELKATLKIMPTAHMDFMYSVVRKMSENSTIPTFLICQFY